MADEESKPLTEAQLQIEKLRRLKEQKNVKIIAEKKDSFSFGELSQVESVRGDAVIPDSIAPKTKTPEVFMADIAATKTERQLVRRVAKKERSCKMERRNFDRVNETVRKIKTSNPGLRLSDDMLVNLIITAVLDLNLDFSTVKTTNELKELFNRIKV